MTFMRYLSQCPAAIGAAWKTPSEFQGIGLPSNVQPTAYVPALLPSAVWPPVALKESAQSTSKTLERVPFAPLGPPFSASNRTTPVPPQPARAAANDASARERRTNERVIFNGHLFSGELMANDVNPRRRRSTRRS